MLGFFVPVIFLFCYAMASLALILFGPTKTRKQADWTVSVENHRFGFAGDHQATAFYVFSRGAFGPRTFTIRIGFSKVVHYLGLLSGMATVSLYLFWYFVMSIDDLDDGHAAAATETEASSR